MSLLTDAETAMSPTSDRLGFTEPTQRGGIYYFGPTDGSAPNMVASPTLQGATHMRNSILSATTKRAMKLIWC